MVSNDEILNAIFNAVDEINEQLASNQTIDKTVEEELFGKKGKLDSLGLVNFIVSTEQNIEDSFDIHITLTDERAMSMQNSPFRTIGTLNDYIKVLIKEKSGS